jgi:hypothetical protein
VLAKAKGKEVMFKMEVGFGPNVDFFTFDEIIALVKKFKEEEENKQGEEEKKGSVLHL